MKVYDLIIIGGSAAATSAGIYAARRGLDFLILTKEFGGEVATSGEIGNWPGVNKTDGITLSRQFKEHLKSYKVEPREGVEVAKITKQEDDLFCVTVKTDGEKMVSDKMLVEADAVPKCDYVSRTVIVATGVHPRTLGIPGEKEFRNKGLSYCTVCDGPLFAGLTAATIGGGNSALESALMLSDICKNVIVINKNHIFKGEEVLINNLKTKKNVEIIYDALTTEIIGNEFVSGLKYIKDGKSEEAAVNGVFVHIGMTPNNKLVPDNVVKNQVGEIVVNRNCETNIPGLYAAGDVTDTPFKQIIIAAGQGTIATLSAVQYLNKIKI
ncbi:MAG: FAD-dependent oxidoreductase [Minisyncoccia bacterium]|jgi:alkyl hydroperoxide reductase subunit AhpF